MKDADPRTVISIAAPDAERRLDQVLAERLRVSRHQAWKLLDAGQVLLNGRPAQRKHKGLKVAVGWRVEVAAQAQAELVIPRPDLPLTVLAEDAGLLIVDKPAGQPVHPLLPGERDTLLNAALARYPDMQDVGEAGLRSGVVHRLDVPTSGALLLGTTQAAWERGRSALTAGNLRKTYLAVVQGNPAPQLDLSLHLEVAQHRPALVRVVEEPTRQSRRCRLAWRKLRTVNDASLVEIDLHTGFLHQIRVMLAHQGHPVLGDPDYGSADTAPRLLLHAWKLELPHLRGVSEPPEAFSPWRS